MTIVGKRTRKPQKMNACMSPGTSRCSSFRWPSTISTSFSTWRGTSAGRSFGFAARTTRIRNHARRAKNPPQTIASTAEDDRSYEPRTFRSSALIAGTISCRSPITA